MIHQKEIFPITKLPPFQQHYLNEDMLLFDIETTGLSPARDQIYCIGCGYLCTDNVVIELFFAENPQEEPHVLEAFYRLSVSRRTIITFNGNTFDIPFVRKRAALYAGQQTSADNMSELATAFAASEPEPKQSSASAGSLIFIDLYRAATGMKSLLRLPSYRQKSLEYFLGISREDSFDGGQLIEKYLAYVSNPDHDLLSFLLLHNFEDVKGMFDLLGLLAYEQLRDGHFQITDIFSESARTNRRSAKSTDAKTGQADNTGVFYSIKIRPAFPLPKSIHMISEDSAAFLDPEKCLIRFQAYNGILKYFYEDYRDYYYLPAEDYAVHKSIGVFVDPSHRKKATAKTCYTKKECEYISFPAKCRSSALRKEYQDKNCYLTLPAKPEELHAFLCRYYSRFFRE